MDDRTGERLDPDLAGRPESIPSGPHQVRAEFAYDGGGLAKGGDVTLYYDGAPAGKGRVEATPPMVFSADETTDIGYESGTPVSPGHTTHSSRFTGKIGWVQMTSVTRTTTTSSTRRSGWGSPWPGSNLPRLVDGFPRQGRTMQRNPMWLVDVSTVWDWRAAGR